MRLTRLETFANEFVCFVKATAEDGVVGWGQTSTYNADITALIGGSAGPVRAMPVRCAATAINGRGGPRRSFPR